VTASLSADLFSILMSEPTEFEMLYCSSTDELFDLHLCVVRESTLGSKVKSENWICGNIWKWYLETL